MRLIDRFLCAIGSHRHLHVIQSYGAAEHIGCPKCGRQMAIHYGLRTILPWDGEIAQLYRDAGYDVDGATDRWKRRIARRAR